MEEVEKMQENFSLKIKELRFYQFRLERFFE